MHSALDQLLFVCSGLMALGCVGNLLIANTAIKDHAVAALRWGSSHAHAVQLLALWRRARRDATWCSVWSAVFFALAVAVESRA